MNISATTWPDGNTDLAGKFFKASLQNLYDRLDMISEGTQMINKKKYIFFEFESRTSGDPQAGTAGSYSKVYLHSVSAAERQNTCLHICMPKEPKDEWQPVAHEIMKRIQVTGSMGR